MPISLRPLPDLTDKQAARFHASYVRAENGCWVWTARVSHRGYGIFYVCSRNQRRSLRAHRLAFAMNKGQPSALVLHRCDNRRCVNPAHLWDGTPTDNMNDMVSKGRNIPGPGRRRSAPSN